MAGQSSTRIRIRSREPEARHAVSTVSELNARHDLNMWVTPTHGDTAPPLDDPLECYHEASSLYPTTMLGQGGPGAMLYAPNFNPERDLGKPTRPSGHEALSLPAPVPLTGELG
jgi:hypothetical protein